MQLRVARLCLDCEELYVGSCCPICASERSAFLTNWLPSEERRRWRRPASRASQVKPGIFSSVKHALNRWFGDEDAEQVSRTLRTRASDHAPDMNFDKTTPESEAKPGATQEPAKVSRRT
jgi:hypothetical protein